MVVAVDSRGSWVLVALVAAACSEPNAPLRTREVVDCETRSEVDGNWKRCRTVDSPQTCGGEVACGGADVCCAYKNQFGRGAACLPSNVCTEAGGIVVR